MTELYLSNGTGVSFGTPEREFARDASERLRTSSPSSQFLGKIDNGIRTNSNWTIQGTGGVYLYPAYSELTVTADTYQVVQSAHPMAYIEGRSLSVTWTLGDFAGVNGVDKYFGYYTSSIIPPFTSELTGIRFRSASNGIYLEIWDNGIRTVNTFQADFTNPTALTNYDWNSFTVISMDFLWLGGTSLRFFIYLPDKGYVLFHTHYHAGTTASSGTPFITSPQQKVRYEITSTTGEGSIRPICSQVSNESGDTGAGLSISQVSPGVITCNAASVSYFLMAVKTLPINQNIKVSINSIGICNQATVVRAGTLLLVKNPILGFVPTYTSDNLLSIAYAFPDAFLTPPSIPFANLGTIIATKPIGQAGGTFPLPQNISTTLTNTLTGDGDVFALVYLAGNSTQTVFPMVELLVYA